MNVRSAILTVLLIAPISGSPAWAKTPLPPCPSDQRALWHNCTGPGKDESGVQYSGSWRDDVLHGTGEVIWPNQGRYVGTFIKGLKNGRGTYYWPDGSKYVGEFRNDVQDGKGVLYTANGEVERSGIWKAGEFVEPPVTRVESSPTVSNTSCSPGPYIEPIDYASAEYIGNPSGKRARMCFYRFNGRDVTNLKFFPGGIFFMKSQTGSGGFAMGGAVLQSIRGTYGFDTGGRLNLRIAYSGTGVTQTVRGPGSSSSLDVSGRDVLENEFTLPNCQKITLRNEIRRYTLGPALRSGRPDHLILEGERWELDSDCGDWEGWK